MAEAQNEKTKKEEEKKAEIKKSANAKSKTSNVAAEGGEYIPPTRPKVGDNAAADSKHKEYYELINVQKIKR